MFSSEQEDRINKMIDSKIQLAIANTIVKGFLWFFGIVLATVIGYLVTSIVEKL